MDDSERGDGGRTAGRFELRRHTADIAVEATGDSLGEAFAAAGAGFTAAHCETVPATGERFGFGVGADSREALLFDYLDELVYRRDADAVLPTDHEVAVHWNGTWVAEAYARGVAAVDEFVEVVEQQRLPGVGADAEAEPLAGCRHHLAVGGGEPGPGGGEGLAEGVAGRLDGDVGGVSPELEPPGRPLPVTAVAVVHRPGRTAGRTKGLRDDGGVAVELYPIRS